MENIELSIISIGIAIASVCVTIFIACKQNKIASQQNKITLFEKRLKTLQTLEQANSFFNELPCYYKTMNTTTVTPLWETAFSIFPICHNIIISELDLVSLLHFATLKSEMDKIIKKLKPIDLLFSISTSDTTKIHSIIKDIDLFYKSMLPPKLYMTEDTPDTKKAQGDFSYSYEIVKTNLQSFNMENFIEELRLQMKLS